MKPFVLIAILLLGSSAFAQLPGKVKKLEGLWEYRQGSGFEKWELRDDVLYGESFRISKFGDTLIAERMEIRSVNKRLTLSVQSYNIIDDSLRIKTRDFIGKKRKMEFSGFSQQNATTITYKPKFFSRKRMNLWIGNGPQSEPRKLVLIRQD